MSPFLLTSEETELAGDWLFTDSLTDVEDYYLDSIPHSGHSATPNNPTGKLNRFAVARQARRAMDAGHSGKGIVLLRSETFMKLRDMMREPWLRPEFEEVGRWRKVATAPYPLLDFYIGPVPKRQVIVLSGEIEVLRHDGHYAYRRTPKIGHDRRKYVR